MQKRENLTELNSLEHYITEHKDTSVAGVQIELLQRLADRVVHDAEEIAVRIRKEAELEATRLIEDANRLAQGIINKAQKHADEAVASEEKALKILEQAKQQAKAIEEAATDEATRSRMKAVEEIKQNLSEVLSKIHKDLQPSLDHLVEKAKILEEEFETTSALESSDAVLQPGPDVPILANLQSNAEQKHGPEEIAGEIETREPLNVTPLQLKNDNPDSITEKTLTTLLAEENGLEDELLEGKVEIDIAPPINMVRVLGVTRYLENTLDIKVLKTSASWNSGIMVTIQLDKPLPLTKLLKEMPRIEEVRLVEEQPSPLGRSGIRKISVSLGQPAD